MTRGLSENSQVLKQAVSKIFDIRAMAILGMHHVDTISWKSFRNVEKAIKKQSSLKINGGWPSLIQVSPCITAEITEDVQNSSILSCEIQKENTIKTRQM